MSCNHISPKNVLPFNSNLQPSFYLKRWFMWQAAYICIKFAEEIIHVKYFHVFFCFKNFQIQSSKSFQAMGIVSNALSGQTTTIYVPSTHWIHFRIISHLCMELLKKTVFIFARRFLKRKFRRNLLFWRTGTCCYYERLKQS